MTNSVLEQNAVVRGLCPHDCPDTCAMQVSVDPATERVVRIQGRAEHVTTHGALCTKVSRYAERTYHPERVLTQKSNWYEKYKEQIIDQRNILKKFTAQMPSINKLSGDLNTTKNPIPQREKALPAAVTQEFNMFRKKTGERQVAKRVDFR